MKVSFPTLVLTAVVTAGTCLPARISQAAEVIIGYTTYPYTQLTFQGGVVESISLRNTGSDLTLNSLGFIDLQPNPTDYHYYYHGDSPTDTLADSYHLQIWLNSAPQTPLADALVTPTSTLIGSFRYAPIAPTTIPSGASFTIAAYLPATMQDGWLDGITGTNLSGISGAVTVGIVNASTTVVSGAFVPEPGTVGLLAAAGMGLARRRRARA